MCSRCFADSSSLSSADFEQKYCRMILRQQSRKGVQAVHEFWMSCKSSSRVACMVASECDVTACITAVSGRGEARQKENPAAAQCPAKHTADYGAEPPLRSRHLSAPSCGRGRVSEHPREGPVLCQPLHHGFGEGIELPKPFFAAQFSHPRFCRSSQAERTISGEASSVHLLLAWTSCLLFPCTFWW